MPLIATEHSTKMPLNKQINKLQLDEVMDVLTNLLSSYSNIYIYKITTFYTWNLHNVICQLYLNKAGKKPRNTYILKRLKSY